MTVDVFAEARRLVSARDVAELNGFHPNKSGFICCPLHREKTPSLKLYPNGTWHCFGCGKGGSSIDLVTQLYDLDLLCAVRRLNDDFHLGLPIDRQQTPVECREAEQAAQRRWEVSNTYRLFEEWRAGMLQQLTACFREGHLALQTLEAPADLDRLTDAQSVAIREQARIEYLADMLSSGEMSDIMTVFRGRGEILRLIEKILNSTPMKSGAA